MERQDIETMAIERYTFLKHFGFTRSQEECDVVRIYRAFVIAL